MSDDRYQTPEEIAKFTANLPVRCCARCKFWQAFEPPIVRTSEFEEIGEYDVQDGECRRRSPTIIAQSERGIDSGWFPNTSYDDWCGEFLQTAELKLRHWLDLHDYPRDYGTRRFLEQADEQINNGRSCDDIIKMFRWQNKKKFLVILRRFCSERLNGVHQ